MQGACVEPNRKKKNNWKDRIQRKTLELLASVYMVDM